MPAAEQPDAEQEAVSKPFSSRVLDANAVKKEEKSRKALMKQFRRAKDIPAAEEVERFDPKPDKGLTPEQVELRFSQLLFNDVNKKYSKSYASIFVGNLCTFFNLLCLIVAVALAYAGAPLSQFLFVAIFAANLIIGIVQEILAKRQIDKLSVLISATAKVMRGGIRTEIPVREIVLDDIVLLEAGQQIPADCILLDGVVEVNESLLTGESVPVKKAPGETLYAGSYVASGACRVRADKVGKATYLNSLTSKAKKYKKPKSEIMNSIRLFIRVIGVLIPFIAAAMFWVNWKATGSDMSLTIQFTGAVVIGMIPSGLLLLTSFAMAIGVRRLAKKQTLVQDLYSLEMLARVNVLCLDKTGTITDGRMTVNDCMILNNYVDFSLEEIMGSMLNALEDNNQTSIALYNRFGHSTALQATATVPFSSKRKLSAVTFGDAGTFAMGAPEFVLRPMPTKIDKIVKQYAAAGLRVLLLAYSPNPISGGRLPSLFRPAAIITLADNIRSDAIETIKWFRENDVDIKIISGDNPVTVSEVARRVGVKNAGQYISLDGLTDLEVENVANQYTVFGRVTPEQKAILVRTIKKQGNTVAMTGDGVNDILALKEADCAVSVASGSEAARNVSHLVLMDSNFSSMPKVVHEGRRVINNIQNSLLYDQQHAAVRDPRDRAPLARAGAPAQRRPREGEIHPVCAVALHSGRRDAVPVRARRVCGHRVPARGIRLAPRDHRRRDAHQSPLRACGHLWRARHAVPHPPALQRPALYHLRALGGHQHPRTRGARAGRARIHRLDGRGTHIHADPVHRVHRAGGVPRLQPAGEGMRPDEPFGVNSQISFRTDEKKFREC